MTNTLPLKKVILVDIYDNEIGQMEKIEAHRKGVLHRAISVFIVNSKGEWLLQQRALNKYHSKGLWTNTCCSHPYPSEKSIDAANRRLMEEMGIKTQLTGIFSFTYKENLDNDLIEHELDHVFIGVSDNLPKINTNEVVNWKYIDYNALKEDTAKYPENYTVWFLKIIERVQQHLLEKK